MQETLKALWNVLDSTINPVIMPEGENIDSGKIRYIHHNVWIYVDDVDGFRLFTDSEAGSLGCDLIV
jgi:hypothetical protein